MCQESNTNSNNNHELYAIIIIEKETSKLRKQKPIIP